MQEPSMSWLASLLARVDTLTVPIVVMALLLWAITTLLAPVCPDWVSGSLRLYVRRLLVGAIWLSLITHGIVACSF